MWAYIEDNTVKSTGSLPSNWGNISNFPAMTLDIIMGYGWYPYEFVYPELTPTQKYGNIEYEILVDKVIGTYLVIEKTVEELQQESDEYLKMLVDAVQFHMDETARTRNYDGILSLCTYATSTNPKFRAEGQSGVEWRDAIWSKCYQIMEEYYLGQIPIPTVESLLEELPIFTWGE